MRPSAARVVENRTVAPTRGTYRYAGADATLDADGRKRCQRGVSAWPDV